ncbi:hypothetical protein [Rhodoferax sp. PAMC 29310]|uniref:hypothetical protein n=1 Tax=Rhodoferax sp. PAMC 29310 TaxID=2822760 RepID=UPI001B33FDA4|nr:hypothetical protein [Rhodoferax sp. PAMC 29310]
MFIATGSIELVHPDSSGSGGFSLANTPLYGGGMTSVHFTRSGYDYAVFARVGRAPGNGQASDPVFEDGVTVSRDGQHLSTRICDDGGAGLQQDIRWLPRRGGN